MLSKKSILLILIGYFIFQIVCFAIIDYFIFDLSIDHSNFLYWDAQHYFFLSQNPYEDFRLAFYPLLPLIWKGLNASAIAISLINACLFYIGFYLLSSILKPTRISIFLYLSVPSFIFFFLPYTESLFFLSSTLILLGLAQEKRNLLLIGLFFAACTRPAFTVFIPALFIVEYLAKHSFKQKVLNLLAYVAITGLGLFSALYVQFRDTGEWFLTFKVQEKWGNHLQIPSLPLRSWAAGIPTRLDGLALLIGLCCALFLLLKLIKVKPLRTIEIPKEVVFSLAYLSGMSLIVLIFRGGSLFSLNRFIFATPFILIALNYFIQSRFVTQTRHIVIAFFVITAYWLLFNSFVHIQAFLKFGSITLIPLLLLSIKHKNAVFGKYALYLLILINIFFQLFLFARFMNGEWVG